MFPENVVFRGALNEPVVKKGDTVLVGQKIGNNNAFVSAPILSSVSGTVKDVGMRLTSCGMLETCVVIENDEKYEKDLSYTEDNFQFILTHNIYCLFGKFF